MKFKVYGQVYGITEVSINVRQKIADAGKTHNLTFFRQTHSIPDIW